MIPPAGSTRDSVTLRGMQSNIPYEGMHSIYQYARLCLLRPQRPTTSQYLNPGQGGAKKNPPKTHNKYHTVPPLPPPFFFFLDVILYILTPLYHPFGTTYIRHGKYGERSISPSPLRADIWTTRPSIGETNNVRELLHSKFRIQKPPPPLLLCHFHLSVELTLPSTPDAIFSKYLYIRCT